MNGCVTGRKPSELAVAGVTAWPLTVGFGNEEMAYLSFRFGIPARAGGLDIITQVVVLTPALCAREGCA